MLWCDIDSEVGELYDGLLAALPADKLAEHPAAAARSTLLA